MKWKIYTISLVITFFTSCNTRKNPKAPPDFIHLLTKEKKVSHPRLHLNGFYHIPCFGKPSFKDSIACTPISFFGNGLLLWDYAEVHHSYKWSNTTYPQQSLEKWGMRNWGTYEIIGDTIKAIIFFQYNRSNDMLYKYEAVHYQGVLSRDSTISDWKMLPPYPKLDEKFNRDIISRQTEPNSFHFQNFSIKTRIDSNKVWINDYRSIKK